MADKICRHGEQIKLKGGGIYFLCRFDWERKDSHCQFVRWCQEDQKYYAQTDKGGNMCPYFEILRSDSYTLNIDNLVHTAQSKVVNDDKSFESSDYQTLDEFKSIFSDEDFD